MKHKIEEIKYKIRAIINILGSDQYYVCGVRGKWITQTYDMNLKNIIKIKAEIEEEIAGQRLLYDAEKIINRR